MKAEAVLLEESDEGRKQGTRNTKTFNSDRLNNIGDRTHVPETSVAESIDGKYSSTSLGNPT